MCCYDGNFVTENTSTYTNNDITCINGGLYASANNTKITMNNLVKITGSLTLNYDKLSELSLPELTEINGFEIRGTALKTISLPKLTKITNYIILKSNSSLEHVYFNSLNELDTFSNTNNIPVEITLNDNLTDINASSLNTLSMRSSQFMRIYFNSSLGCKSICSIPAFRSLSRALFLYDNNNCDFDTDGSPPKDTGIFGDKCTDYYHY